MASTTGVFPAELWEAILNVLEEVGGGSDTEAGLNIINASTQLRKSFRKELSLFAMKKAIRLLFENHWIDLRDLLNLRLVSKSINHFIHRYISEKKRVVEYEAYDPAKHGPEMRIPRLRMDKDVEYFHSNPRSKDFVGLRFHKFLNSDDLDDRFSDDEEEAENQTPKILTDLKLSKNEGGLLLPGSTVPLLVLRSAAVHLDAFGFEGEYNHFGQVRNVFWQFLEAVDYVFGRVGNHVWSLSFKYGLYGNFNFRHFPDMSYEIWERLFKLLARLPNLKHLSLEGVGSNFLREMEGYHEGEPDPFAEVPETLMLPNLESIEATQVDVAVRTLLPKFAEKFADQLRRLSLPMTIFLYLEPDPFKNLTEVEVTSCNPVMGRIDDGSFGSLRRFLDKLDSPVARLKLEFRKDYRWQETDGEIPEVTLEAEVIHWMKRFPTLQSLEVLSGGVFIEETTPNLEEIPFPNLKFLKIEDGNGGLSFQFLRRLPSLQYLHLMTSPLPTVWDDSVEFQQGMIKLKKELEHARLYDSNVWEALPNLETVTVQPSFFQREKKKLQFKREGFKRLKLKEQKLLLKGSSDDKGNGICQNENFTFREDILRFLELYARKPSKDFWEIEENESEPESELEGEAEESNDQYSDEEEEDADSDW